MKAEDKAKRLFTESYADKWLRMLDAKAMEIARDIDCDRADWYWAMQTHHLYRDEICLYELVCLHKEKLLEEEKKDAVGTD